MTNYDKGTIVVNASGVFAKVLYVKKNVHFCTQWFETLEAAKAANEMGARFNQTAQKSLKIKPLSQGGRANPKEKTEKEAEAEKEAKGVIKATN